MRVLPTDGGEAWFWNPSLVMGGEWLLCSKAEAGASAPLLLVLTWTASLHKVLHACESATLRHTCTDRGESVQAVR